LSNGDKAAAASNRRSVPYAKAVPARPTRPIRSDQSQRCVPQYLSQRAVRPLRIMAQEISPERGDVQKAAVRVPPAPPRDRQRMAGPRTRI